MPGGKVRIRGAVGHSRVAPRNINISSLNDYIREGTAPIRVPERLDLASRLKTATNRLQIRCKKAAVAHTPTELRSQIAKVQRWAKRICSKKDSSQSREKLIVAIGASLALQDLLHGHLRRSGMDLYKQLTNLNDSIEFEPSKRIPNKNIQKVDPLFLRILAELNPKSLVPKGRWPDPDLAMFVGELIPIWERVTGRSASSTDKADRKASKFGEWVRHLLAELRLSVRQPSDDTLRRMVRWHKQAILKK